MFSLGEINLDAASRLASQVVTPRLREEVFPAQGSEKFRLRDKVYAILNDEVEKGNLTQEQLKTTCHTKNGGNHSLESTTRWYTRNILMSSGEITLSDTPGYYFLADAESIDDEQDEGMDGVESVTGSIYAYTFPSLIGKMIKVGMASGNVEDRVNEQLRTANPEAPTILRIWSVVDIVGMEKAIHSILKTRGKWVDDTPRAKEWFRTSVEEVESIIDFIQGR